MHIVEILGQLETGRAQTAANESIENLLPLATRSLTVFLVQICQIDEAFAATLDQELLRIIAKFAVATRFAQLGHDELRELIARRRAKEKIEPSHYTSPMEPTLTRD